MRFRVMRVVLAAGITAFSVAVTATTASALREPPTLLDMCCKCPGGGVCDCVWQIAYSCLAGSCFGDCRVT
jgi:hypothetical protein